MVSHPGHEETSFILKITNFYLFNNKIYISKQNIYNKIHINQLIKKIRFKYKFILKYIFINKCIFIF